MLGWEDMPHKGKRNQAASSSHTAGNQKSWGALKIRGGDNRRERKERQKIKIYLISAFIMWKGEKRVWYFVSFFLCRERHTREREDPRSEEEGEKYDIPDGNEMGRKGKVHSLNSSLTW